MSKIQNIGLMMTYNEADIIEETIEKNRHYFDAIYVLDGSTDQTAEILQSYDVVKCLIKDQDLYPSRVIKDGVRQFLLEKAQADYGYDGWFTLLHGDEWFVDDPNDIIKKAEKSGAERVNWRPLNFFLHTSQKDTYSEQKSIEDRLLLIICGKA